MDPRLVDQLLQTILPVALVLIAINIGAKMTGFGNKFVQKLTVKVTHGLLAIAIVWIVIAALVGSFHH
jgi:hypothetical protein